MKKTMRRAAALFLAAAMVVMNLSAFTVLASDEGEKKEAKVSAPGADLKAGTYEDTQKVTLTCATKGAVIYYTVNGDKPTEKSTKFDPKKPIEVKATATIKAIAVKDGNSSEVKSFAYVLGDAAGGKDTLPPQSEKPPVAAQETTPVATPEAAPESTPEVTPEAAPVEKEVPSDKDARASATSPGNVSITAGTNLEVGSQWTDGEDTTNYLLQEGAGNCTITAAEWKETGSAETTGTFAEGKSYECAITLTAAAGSAFDGTEVIQMYGKTGITQDTPGDVITYTFTGFQVPKAPTAAPAPGSVEILAIGDKVTLEAEEGILSYKIGDEAQFTQAAGVRAEITVAGAAGAQFKLTAKAAKDCFDNIQSFTYNIEDTLPTPTINNQGGSFTSPQTIQFGMPASGTTIRYTLDGMTEPSRTVGIIYDGNPFKISKTTTLKAIAYSDTARSPVASFAYTITELKKIKKAAVTDLVIPFRGEKPKYTAKVSDKSPYKFVSVEWTDENKKDLNKNKVFKASSEYYVYITLRAKTGYEFDKEVLQTNSETNVLLTINGERAARASVEKKELVIYWRYKTGAAQTAEAGNCTITGISASYTQGTVVQPTATGAGADNPDVEGNERYIPVSYSLGNKNGSLNTGADKRPAVRLTISGLTAATHKLSIAFQKQVYSGDDQLWKNTEDETFTRTADIKVVSSGNNNKKAGTITPKPTVTTAAKNSTRTTGAKTGDETPVGALIALVAVAAAGITVVLILRKKRAHK